MLDKFLSEHTEGFTHEIIHAAAICPETSADILEGHCVMGVPIGLREEGGDGFKFFHAGKLEKKHKKKQEFSSI